MQVSATIPPHTTCIHISGRSVHPFPLSSHNWKLRSIVEVNTQKMKGKELISIQILKRRIDGDEKICTQLSA